MSNKKTIVTFLSILAAASFATACSDDSSTDSCDCTTGTNCTEDEKAACEKPKCDCATGTNCTEDEKSACEKPKCDCATGTNCTEDEKAACQQPKCDCATGANCTEDEKAACALNCNPDTQHEYNGACEDDTVEHCGTHENNCTTSIDHWGNGTCTNKTCVPTSCAEGFELKGTACEACDATCGCGKAQVKYEDSSDSCKEATDCFFAIRSAADFYAMEPDKDYVLTNDITIDYSDAPEGYVASKLNKKFFGEGHTITVNYEGEDFHSLFGTLEGQIRNLSLNIHYKAPIGKVVDDKNAFGLLAAVGGRGVELWDVDAHFDVDISGAKSGENFKFGGLIGTFSFPPIKDGEISNVAVDGTIKIDIEGAATPFQTIGGMFGDFEGSVSYLASDVNLDIAAKYAMDANTKYLPEIQIGGIVGRIYNNDGILHRTRYGNLNTEGQIKVNTNLNAQIGCLVGSNRNMTYDQAGVPTVKEITKNYTFDDVYSHCTVEYEFYQCSSCDKAALFAEDVGIGGIIGSARKVIFKQIYSEPTLALTVGPESDGSSEFAKSTANIGSGVAAAGIIGKGSGNLLVNDQVKGKIQVIAQDGVTTPTAVYSASIFGMQGNNHAYSRLFSVGADTVFSTKIGNKEFPLDKAKQLYFDGIVSGISTINIGHHIAAIDQAVVRYKLEGSDGIQNINKSAIGGENIANSYYKANNDNNVLVTRISDGTRVNPKSFKEVSSTASDHDVYETLSEQLTMNPEGTDVQNPTYGFWFGTAPEGYSVGWGWLGRDSGNDDVITSQIAFQHNKEKANYCYEKGKKAPCDDLN